MKRYRCTNVNPYWTIDNPQRVLFQLESYQDGAINYLASVGILNRDLLRKDILVGNADKIPAELRKRIVIRNSEKVDLFNLLINEFSKIQLTGPGGLKDRSSLMEYRYDRKMS
jgi:hypothetical protein